MIVILFSVISFLFQHKLIDAIKVSANPIRINLRKFGRNFNESNPDTFKPKTKPEFFKRVLDLDPNEPFDFNLDRWNALLRCGLFHNLSTHAFPNGDGVGLDIFGWELPSVTVSPELTLEASISKPEISGGVRDYFLCVKIHLKSTFNPFTFLCADCV